MSELTECNYCKFQKLRREYKGKGGVRVVADALKDSRTGFVVFGAGVRVVERKTGKDIGVWFAELPNQCCC